MPAEKKIQNDDPQIHLLAAKYCEKFRGILQGSVDDKGINELKTCIQFFAHYIKYLPECCTDVLNLCKGFLGLIKDKSTEFDVTVVNRIVGICTTILIRRKEEEVIRNACFVLKDTVEIIPSTTLNVIVTRYSKSLTLIFQKMYLVQSYFTQLRILDIFVFITKDLKNMRNDTISRHPLLRTAKEETKKIVIEKVNKIDCNDFENSSRKFLRIFNNNLFPKTCILSVEGRMTKMNGYPVKQKENMLVNFNGRNLTISFFVPNNLFLKDPKEKAKKENEFLVFIEFECKSIDSISKVYKGRHYVDVSMEVDHAMTYNGDMTRDNLDGIKKISLRLIDEEVTLKTFTDMFYEKYKQNERMMSEHPSCADKMSIMTFRTSASLLNDLKTMNETKAQLINDTKVQNVVKQDEIPKHEEEDKKHVEKIKNIEIKPRNESVFDDLIVKKETSASKKTSVPATQTKQSQVQTRPKRQSAKKANDRLSDIFDEENMKDDEKVTTNYRDFKEQQKKKNSAEAKTTKNMESQDSNRNYYLEPVEIVTRTTLKSKTTKFNKYESKPKHYDTEEENREVKRKERAAKKEAKKLEPKIQRPKTERKAKEPVDRKPLTNFDLNKNVANDIKSMTIKNQKQTQKRKFSENPASGNLLLDNDIEMEMEAAVPSVKVVKQSINVRKVASDHSINSGRSPTPEIYKKKAACKRPMEDDKKEVRTQKRRRLTVENVFELCESDKEPKLTDSTSKVEEWLKSTSDSFSFDMSVDHNEPEIPLIQNTVQNTIINVVPKEVQGDDVDNNESEMSFGQFANDEHQHYSSSSHESMDLDVKNVPKQKTVKAAIEKTPKLTQNYGFDYPSTSRHITNASQNNNNLVMDPCHAFNTRCSEAVVELTLRKKKIDASEREVFKKYEQYITKYGKKCLDQVQKTKTQLKHVNQLHLRYESAKSKLMDELIEQEKMFQILKREVGKLTDSMEIRNQSKQKELMNLKKEALRKNEELMQDAWREYIDNFQSSFNNSIQKAYEI